MGKGSGACVRPEAGEADSRWPSVMMGWEEPLMREHVRVMAEERAQNGEALNILNIGYGLGIVRADLC